MRDNIQNYLEQFPNNATSWSQATDEIRDLARTAKEYYNELVLEVFPEDPNALQPLNFRALNTPSEWNTKGKKYILDTFDKMNQAAQSNFYHHFAHWFNRTA